MERLSETLGFSYNTEVDSAYVITINGHGISEPMAKRCHESCEKVGMKSQRWEAFDGTKGNIFAPKHLEGQKWVKWIKVVNEALAKTEVCTVLSHVSLWARCIEIDKPIVILEHDAVMMEKFTHHPAFNAIIYLGSIEQVQNNYWGSIPIHGQLNQNYRFQLRTHAYSIDPMIAKRLLGDIVRSGIRTSIDVMIRADIYTILQFGIYAFDMADGKSTAPEKDDKKSDLRLMRINNKII
jgi:GR25 family glycosyltransferase involved in LPS biosynthesis